MTANITITANFDNLTEASEFMNRIGHPLVITGQSVEGAAKPTKGKTPTSLPVTTPEAGTAKAAAPVAPATAPVQAATAAAPAPDAAAVALVMPTATPAPQVAAPKQPNTPVAAVVNANKQPVPLHPATQDGVRAALKDVFNLRGATVATELLKKHGAVSVSTVAKEQFASFVKAASES